MTEQPIDAPEADVAEQSEEVVPVERRTPRSDSPEVDDFDAEEQSRMVDLDPDEYR